MKKIKPILLGIILGYGTTVFAQGGFPGLTVNNQQQSLVAATNVTTLDELLSGNLQNEAQTRNAEAVNALRRDALIEVASALGASAGLNYRMEHYRVTINKRSAELDKIFDFSKLTIANSVLAPVLTEGLASFNLDSTEQVRIADKIYRIEIPARFVSVYPTWRSYLRFSFPTFEVPPSAFLPQNEAERAIWDRALRDGWQRGILHADRLFQSSMSRLERDYFGMIRFKLLLEQGLITPTVVAAQNLGVTGGGREMAINDQIFRIMDHSALDPNVKNWRVQYPITNMVNGILK